MTESNADLIFALASATKLIASQNECLKKKIEENAELKTDMKTIYKRSDGWEYTMPDGSMEDVLMTSLVDIAEIAEKWVE
jgi:hypothetical protein